MLKGGENPLYCIYSGKEIKEGTASPEHIIPLSLGGCNALTIQVEKGINNRLGSEIDGKMANDFFVALNRIRSGTKGHSGKAPSYRVPSNIGGRPVITTFEKDGMKLFDPRERTYLQGQYSVQMSFGLDVTLRTRFTAKVALATGYFLFGDRFVQHADCDALRTIMLSRNLQETFQSDAKKLKNLRFYDSFTKEKPEDKPWIDIYKMYCEILRGSNVLWTYSPQSIIVHVGILGKFIGCVNFEADVQAFPSDGDYWLGHVLLCKNNTLIRNSWRAAVMEMAEKKQLLSPEQLEEARQFAHEQLYKHD